MNGARGMLMLAVPRVLSDLGVGEPARSTRRQGGSAMGKKSTSRRGEPVDSGRPGKLKTKEYEKHMRVLHGELVAMQEWVKASGAKIVIVFEGRDTAGKGGTIKRITERVSPGSSGWSRCRRRPSARSRRCTSSGTCPTCRPRVRWSSSTAAGTTAPASSGSWDSPRWIRSSDSWSGSGGREDDGRVRHSVDQVLARSRAG